MTAGQRLWTDGVHQQQDFVAKEAQSYSLLATLPPLASPPDALPLQCTVQTSTLSK